MQATILNICSRTVIEDGKADEAVGIDVLVHWDVSDEYDFG